MWGEGKARGRKAEVKGGEGLEADSQPKESPRESNCDAHAHLSVNKASLTRIGPYSTGTEKKSQVISTHRWVRKRNFDLPKHGHGKPFYPELVT